jgi:hypothetical protein
MSAKHNQRTRAQILAKRAEPIAVEPVMKHVLGVGMVSAETIDARMLRRASASKLHASLWRKTSLENRWVALP